MNYQDNNGNYIPPSQRNKKELLVFATYINTGSMSAAKERQRFVEIRSLIQGVFEGVEEQTNYLVKLLFFPVKDQDTKIECVFPRNNDNIINFSKDLLDSVKDICDQTGTDINTLLDDNETDEDIDEDWGAFNGDGDDLEDNKNMKEYVSKYTSRSLPDKGWIKDLMEGHGLNE